MVIGERMVSGHMLGFEFLQSFGTVSDKIFVASGL